MIGDQLLTDVWGGNRSGLTTVLVTPIDLSIEPGFVRFKRLLERPFL
jgi:predicted HAD superfamily phosphohydrolase YqeG